MIEPDILFQRVTPRLDDPYTNYDLKKKLLDNSNQAALKQKQLKQAALHKPTTAKVQTKSP